MSAGLVPLDLQRRIDTHREAEQIRSERALNHAEAVALVTETRAQIARLPEIERTLRKEIDDLERERATLAWSVLAGDLDDDVDAALERQIARLRRRLFLVETAAEELAAKAKQQQLRANRLVVD